MGSGRAACAACVVLRGRRLRHCSPSSPLSAGVRFEGWAMPAPAGEHGPRPMRTFHACRRRHACVVHMHGRQQASSQRAHCQCLHHRHPACWEVQVPAGVPYMEVRRSPLRLPGGFPLQHPIVPMVFTCKLPFPAPPATQMHTPHAYATPIYAHRPPVKAWRRLDASRLKCGCSGTAAHSLQSRVRAVLLCAAGLRRCRRRMERPHGAEGR